jgi:prolipoprotein diacylglyceryltransferase
VFERVDKYPRHPSQLYESIAYLVTFGLLSWIFFSGRYQKRKGLLLGIFFTLVFTARFIIEFLKEPQVGFENQLPLDLGQLLSIPFVLCGLWLIYRALRAPAPAPAPIAATASAAKSKRKK